MIPAIRPSVPPEGWPSDPVDPPDWRAPPIARTLVIVAGALAGWVCVCAFALLSVALIAGIVTP